MRYSIVTLADIHWGAMDSILMYQNLELVLQFIQQMKDKLDLVVIAGDYFDYRLQLNSKTALLAVEWFDRLIRTCKESGVKRIRMFKGTSDHDNDQLEVFRPTYEVGDDYFRLYTETTSEEVLPGLRCVFCPDENMNLRQYHRTYQLQFIPSPDIGFFHGSFDWKLPDIEYERIQSHDIATMIYEYIKFARLIKGPLISGHWHVACDHEAMFYVGSYDRWAFDEEEPKGFLYTEYDTESHKYFMYRIQNPLAKEFKTLYISDETVNTPADFSELTGTIDNLLYNNPDMKLRVVYIISTDNPAAMVAFNAFQKKYATISRFKITVKDLIKRELKKEKKQQTQIEASRYGYVFDSDPHKIPSIIQQFIKDKRNVDIDIDVVEKFVSKYFDLK